MEENLEKQCEYLYKQFVIPHIQEINGIKILEEKDYFKIELSKNVIDYLLKKYNIKLIDKITKDSRSKYVRDADFGKVKTADLIMFDEPKYLLIKYDSNGNIVNEDYSKLENFIEKEFIPNNIQYKTTKNENNEIVKYPSIQYNKIVGLKLSEQEVEYVLFYLNELNIRVGGIDQGLDFFENYDYYRTYKNDNLLKPKSKQDIINDFITLRQTNDPDLRKEIIEYNMRLVKSIAWKEALRFNVPKEDAEQYGYEGLIKAVDNFDPYLGYAFSTYAYVVIRRFIKRALKKEIDTPSESWIDKYLLAKKVVEEEYGENIYNNPNLIEEVADLLIRICNLSSSKKDEIISRINIIEKISLNEMLDNNQDIYSTENEEKTYIASLQDQIKLIINTLTPKERDVIIYRFGLDGNTPKTLDEVGSIFNVTRERIRQIEAKALRKLRHPLRTRKIQNSILEYEDENTIEIEHKIKK